MTVPIAIIGATGYTGLELVRLLLRHPHIQISALTSEQSAGKDFSELFPSFLGALSLKLEPFQPEIIAQKAKIAFLCLPHQKAMEGAQALRKLGIKVIDLSADFRLHEHATYEAWYGPHSCPDLLKEAVYGLPELHREQIQSASLIANPGCYPTSCILALAPLIQAGLIELDSIHCDAKSGVSGAGRKAELGNLFCETHEGLKAYKIGQHRHTPEIEQEVSALAKTPVILSFTPHLIPMSRGILATVYAKANNPLSREALHQLYVDFYRDAAFVRVRPLGNFPGTHEVRYTNFCDLGVEFDSRTGRYVIISAIDNLVKGASGQAIQNMNLMMGFPEDSGLEQLAPIP